MYYFLLYNHIDMKTTIFAQIVQPYKLAEKTLSF